jgi:hypothetical protein
MLAFRDFAPKVLEDGGWLSGPAYEDFDAALEAANAWIAADSIDVVNVETVVLPNIYSPGEQGTVDPELGMHAGRGTWHQFLRVWFRA